MGKATGSAPVRTFRLGALATASDPEIETANESQSKSSPSPKVNFARLFCERDSFKFGFKDDWEFDSGMDEGGKPKLTFGDGELGGCEIGWRVGSGDEFVNGELDGRGGNGGELGEEDGVRSGGELDGGEFSEGRVRRGSEDGVRGGDDLDGSGGAISGTVDFNSGSCV